MAAVWTSKYKIATYDVMDSYHMGNMQNNRFLDLPCNFQIMSCKLCHASIFWKLHWLKLRFCKPKLTKLLKEIQNQMQVDIIYDFILLYSLDIVGRHAVQVNLHLDSMPPFLFFFFQKSNTKSLGKLKGNNKHAYCIYTYILYIENNSNRKNFKRIQSKNIVWFIQVPPCHQKRENKRKQEQEKTDEKNKKEKKQRNLMRRKKPRKKRTKRTSRDILKARMN